MYRIVGATAVVLSGTMVGFILAHELSERIKCLRDIYRAAISIKSELEYRAPVIEDCFRDKGELFSLAGKFIKNEQDLPKDALIKACDSIKCLNNEDKEVIYSYAESIYMEDISGQIANVEWLIDALKLRITDAENTYKAKGKLLKSGGVLIGIGIVILLL